MKRFNEVKEILKGVQLASSTNTDSRITSDKEKIEEQKATIAEKNKELEALKLRLNDCYQMLEDQGIDPQFVIRPRLKKHKEA
jgi:peptidoglycan hydrolase CwlO-like protein